MSLAFATGAKEWRVTEIRAEEKLRRHLINLGFAVGCRLQVYGGGQDVVCRIKDTKLALGRSVAMKIMVEECV